MKSTSVNDSLDSKSHGLRGKRVAVLVFSHYPSDPRPRREAETMAQEGAEVDVISLEQNPGDLRRETCNGINVFRVPLRHWRGGKLSYMFQYGSFILACFFTITFRHLRRRYDLVHVHNMPDVLVFSAIVPRLLGAKVILDLHDPMPELMMSIYGLREDSVGVRLMKVLERWSIRCAHLVLTPNIAFQKLFIARGCPPQKLRVIMNSPDEGIFPCRDLATVGTQNGHPGRPLTVMYHGAIVERHGLDIAVAAFKSVIADIPNAELHIFGRRTPFLDQVLEQVKKLGLDHAVKYHGPKSLEQIVKAIDACDLGVIPNRGSVFTEINMPTRIFEYLARGKAVIAPRTSGIQDYFSGEEIAFFQPGDEPDLAEKIKTLLKDAARTRELVCRGQAVYRAHRWSEERKSFLQGTSALLARNGA
ncbi:MAG TPA: glycosyltransferase family 4 protein [Verrucomicrobiae bacterium]|nr:glycosyltransferase family 4 protein [Verrucomicrobiae bacterium]